MGVNAVQFALLGDSRQLLASKRRTYGHVVILGNHAMRTGRDRCVPFQHSGYRIGA